MNDGALNAAVAHRSDVGLDANFLVDMNGAMIRKVRTPCCMPGGE